MKSFEEVVRQAHQLGIIHEFIPEVSIYTDKSSNEEILDILMQKALRMNSYSEALIEAYKEGIITEENVCIVVRNTRFYELLKEEKTKQNFFGKKELETISFTIF